MLFPIEKLNGRGIKEPWQQGGSLMEAWKNAKNSKKQKNQVQMKVPGDHLDSSGTFS
jgi:hypothetical protein